MSFLIVPGLGDSGEGHWQTHWEQRFPDVRRVQQVHWDEPDLQRWSDQVVRTLEAHGDAWVVAHSFGCLATVHALARVQSLVKGVFLVAPADPDKFDVAEQLPHHPLPVRGAVVGSRSDPWLSFENARLWGLRWELPVFDAGDAGHINVASGHGAWEQGWRWLHQLRRHGRNTLQLVDVGANQWLAQTGDVRQRQLLTNSFCF
jgi:predicted alpha/beta hydrolase family esterase